ncbi:MAG: GDSL-type esterase/lipase family protein [Candidatus Howiella sp.]
MRKFARGAMGLLLTAALVFSSVISAAAIALDTFTWADFNATSGTSPAWVAAATTEEKNATVQAIKDEYAAQLADGYNLGEMESFSNYGDIVNAQFSGADSNNVGNPWGHEGRKWAAIVCPFPGIAFTARDYFAVKMGGVIALYNNQFTWTDPTTGVAKLYQQTAAGAFTRDPDGTEVRRTGSTPGAGALDSATKATMQKLFATCAYMGANLGYAVSACEYYDGYAYQEYFGPDSTGASAQANRGLDKAYGISYVVAKGEEAYIIADELLTAWASTWKNLDTANPDRFSVSGLPVSNPYETEDGYLCQDFENLVAIVSPEGEASVVSRVNTVTSVAGPSVIGAAVDGESINILAAAGADLSALELTLRFSDDDQLTDIFNFSEPDDLVITSATGEDKTYHVTVYLEDSLTDEQKSQIRVAQRAIDKLPVYLFSEDVMTAQTAIEFYDQLDDVSRLDVSRLAVQDVDKLESARERMAEMEEETFRITCVGDSITEGIGASSGAANYPSQLQRLLGNGYAVTNAGTSGAFASEEACWLPYITTNGYITGMNSNPDLVFMMLGTNDAWKDYWNQTDVDFPELFETGYRKLIERYQAMPSSPKIVLCLPMTSYNDASDGRESNNVNGTIPIIRKLAEEYGLDILDMHSFTEGHSEWFGDGLHPNDTGYAKVAEKFAEKVNEIMTTGEEVSVSGILLDGQPLADFNADTTEYTVKADSYDFPRLTVTSDGDYKLHVTQATRLNPVAYVSVESLTGHHGVTYTIRYDVQTVKPGDVDGDGTVTVSDVVELRKLIVGGSWTEREFEAGNLESSDSALTVSDVVALRALIVAG